MCVYVRVRMLMCACVRAHACVCVCVSSMAESSASVAEAEVSFRKFAVHGDTKATGKEMNGKNFAKLCKDCRVMDGKNVTATDVDIVFTKVK